MNSHAKLSASGASRWLACTPSARMEADFPDEQSIYAAEGTFAHAVADLRLAREIANTIKPSEYKTKLAQLQKNEFYTKALEGHIDAYVAQVAEIFLEHKKACPDTLVMLEQRLDFSHCVPEGFGTGDVVIISDTTLEVIDLKYGKGVQVYAVDNPQTRLYSLGALASHGMLYDFDRVRMTIVQPRLDHIDSEELPTDALTAWGESIKSLAAMAFEGAGEAVSGTHCKFCRARAVCRTRAEENLALAEYEFKKGGYLKLSELADILTRAPELMKWAADVAAYCLEKATGSEKLVFPGHKLVEGKANRRYTDPKAILDTLLVSGYKEDDVAPREVLGLTKMEKLVGKKELGELCGTFIEKPRGKPTLVVESDPRPVWDDAASAAADFS